LDKRLKLHDWPSRRPTPNDSGCTKKVVRIIQTDHTPYEPNRVAYLSSAVAAIDINYVYPCMGAV
jgi:hypothetical protein